MSPVTSAMAGLRERLADPTTRTAAAVEFGDWARNLCIFMGAELQTALNVGAAATMGLEANRNQVAPDEANKMILRDIGALYESKVKHAKAEIS